MNLSERKPILFNTVRRLLSKVTVFGVFVTLILMTNYVHSQRKTNPEIFYFQELRAYAGNDPKYFKPIVEEMKEYYQKLSLSPDDLHQRMLANCRRLKGDPEGYIIHSIVVFDLMYKKNNRFAMAEMVHHVEKYIDKIDNLYLKTFIENIISIYYSMLNRNDEAKTHLIKALNYAKENNDTLNVQIIQGNIAREYFISKDYEKSEYYLQRSISWEDFGYTEGFVVRRNALATMYTCVDGKELRAFEIFESIKDCTSLDPGLISYGMGELQMKLKNPEIALQHFLKAEQDYSVGHSNLELLYNDLALCYSELANFECAYHYVQMRDSLRINQNKLEFLAQYEELKAKNAKRISKLKIENSNVKLLVEKGKTTQLYFILIIVLVVLITTILGVAFQRKKIRELVKLNLAEVNRKDNIDNANSKRNIPEGLINSIIHHIETKKVFKNSDISLWNLSKLLESNTKDVSVAINSHYGMSFRTLINTRRVELAKQMLLKKEYEKYSIAGIAETVGYTNKSSFYKNFKTITGVTPSDFQRVGSKLLEIHNKPEDEEE